MEPENEDNNPTNPAGPPTDDPGLENDNLPSADSGPTEREALLESQLSAMQETSVSATIEQLGYLPRAIYAHTPLTELLGEDGKPDPDKIAAATTAAAAEFGLAHVPSRARPKPVTTLGSGSDGPPPVVTWANVLRPNTAP